MKTFFSLVRLKNQKPATTAIAAFFFLFLFQAFLLPPASTIVGVGSLDGSLNHSLGFRADWEACACTVSPGVVKITEGSPIPMKITTPEQLRSRSIAQAEEGDAVEVTWLGGNRWRVKHLSSGKEFIWKWTIPPVKKEGEKE